MKTRAVLTVLVAGALLLTGCTSPAPESGDPTPSVTPSATPTPTPEPSPTDGIQVHSDPATGIVFEDVPDLTGDEAAVYNWIATHQNAFWETLRTNKVSATYASMSSTEVQDTAARIAANNASNGVRIGGEFHTRISDIVVTGDTATGLVCDDFRQATFTTDAGEFTAEDVQQNVPERGRLELLRLENGVWYVNRVVGEGTC